MPCRSEPWEDIVRPVRHEMTIEDFEAVLCGIFAAHEKLAARTGYKELEILLGDIDWKEVGVPKTKVKSWWKKHKQEDAERRAREAVEKQKEELRKTAISKLTPEELEILGIRL